MVLPEVRESFIGLHDGQAIHPMHDKKLRAVPLATSQAGHGNGRGSGRAARLEDFRDDNSELVFSGNAPRIEIRVPVRATYGGHSSETPPCGKCGCEFLNVGCPKIWPIGTVVLTCAMCGSVVDYVDGLLIMTVVEAITNAHGSEWVKKRRMAYELSAERGLDENVILLAMEQGMTMDEIVTALDLEMS
jgi:hypothetical protein